MRPGRYLRTVEMVQDYLKDQYENTDPTGGKGWLEGFLHGMHEGKVVDDEELDVLMDYLSTL